jgi:transcriptional regulator with XRE-family HTH domain
LTPRGDCLSGELVRALEHGLFSDALRAAIAARGLSLDRIQDRLARRGIRLSVATLSYWQSGQRRPERPVSLLALEHLEAVLELPAAGLSSLLGPPRPHGRRTHADRLPSLVELWSAWPEARRLLAGVDSDSDASLRRLSQHDRIQVGPDGRPRTISCRQVVTDPAFSLFAVEPAFRPRTAQRGDGPDRVRLHPAGRPRGALS